jgi:hypothetical protein
MLLSIKINDDTYLKYAEMDKNSPQRAIERQIERFKNVPLDKRTLVISDEVRVEIEKLFGHDVAENFPKFLEWLKRMGTIQVEPDSFLELAPEVMVRLKAEADFYKKTTKDYLKEKLMNIIRKQW